MLCGLVDKEFNHEVVDISKDNVSALAHRDDLLSIDVNQDFSVFIPKDIYTQENMNNVTNTLNALNEEFISKR